MRDFDGMKAGVIKTYSYDHKFDTAKNFTKVQFNNMNDLLNGLINNKVDFIIGDFNTILFISKLIIINYITPFYISNAYFICLNIKKFILF